jgi:hypothetical protein
MRAFFLLWAGVEQLKQTKYTTALEPADFSSLHQLSNKGTNTGSRQILTLVHSGQLDLLNLATIDIHDRAPASRVLQTSSLWIMIHHLQIVSSLPYNTIELAAIPRAC